MLKGIWAFVLAQFFVITFAHRSSKRGSEKSGNSSWKPQSWIQDILPELGDASYFDVTMPGTHDAATYKLYEVFAPGSDEALEDIVKLAKDLGIDVYPVIESWATAQNVTLFDQLSQGIRFIDLRACNNGTSGWRTHHMIMGNPIHDLLEQVRSYLELPDVHGEVVTLHVSHFYGTNTNDTRRRELAADIHSVLGKWLVRRPATLPAPPSPSTNPLALPLRQLLAGGSKVLVSFGDHVVGTDPEFPGLWPDTDTLAGSYCNMDNLGDMLACNEAKALQLPLGADGKISEMWYTLTEQTDDIIAGLLEPGSHPTSLHELCAPADARFLSWAHELSNSTLGNALLVDWFQTTGVVEWAVNDALRLCVDDMAWRARDAGGAGQDCRSWALAGNCTALNSKRCPRSCQVCQ